RAVMERLRAFGLGQYSGVCGVGRAVFARHARPCRNDAHAADLPADFWLPGGHRLDVVVMGHIAGWPLPGRGSPYLLGRGAGARDRDRGVVLVAGGASKTTLGILCTIHAGRWR